MNGLSWLIYAASVADGLKAGFVIGAFVSGFIGILLLVFGFDIPYRYSWMQDEEWAEQKARPGFLRLLAKRVIGVAIACIFLTAITPSSQTMYLMAASQVGQQVANSPDGQEMLGQIKTIIKHKLTEYAKE